MLYLFSDFPGWPTIKGAVWFPAYRGVRIGEVLGIQWQLIDFETGRLTLPETKTGRRVHDLPASALAVLGELPRFSAWAFTRTGTAAITYRTMRKHFVEIAAMMDGGGGYVEPMGRPG